MIFRKQEKLVNYVHDKIKCSVHIRALIPYLNYRIKVKKYRAINFDQRAWSKPHIKLNII